MTAVESRQTSEPLNVHGSAAETAGLGSPYLRTGEAQQAEGEPLQACQVQLQRSCPVAGRVRRVLTLHDRRPLVRQARQLPAALHEHLSMRQRTTVRRPGATEEVQTSALPFPGRWPAASMTGMLQGQVACDTPH